MVNNLIFNKFFSQGQSQSKFSIGNAQSFNFKQAKDARMSMKNRRKDGKKQKNL